VTSTPTPLFTPPPKANIIPESILQNCIKVSNEPPSDMASNMRRALAAFSPDLEGRLSSPAKVTAFRSILFGLCFYHSLLLGRKKFGVGIGTGGLVGGGGGWGLEAPSYQARRSRVFHSGR
jgi:dynein heavy chain